MTTKAWARRAGLSVLVAGAILGEVRPASADCTCACIKGVMQGVCTKPNEKRPDCAQTACGAQAPAPLDARGVIMTPGGPPRFCRTKEGVDIWTGRPILKTFCM